jgi:hypothetical protein
MSFMYSRNIKGPKAVPWEYARFYMGLSWCFNFYSHILLTLKNLDKLVNWASEWQMKFNASKCYVLKITNKKKPVLHNYTMHDQLLENVDQNPYTLRGLKLFLGSTPDFTWAFPDVSTSTATFCWRYVSHALIHSSTSEWQMKFNASKCYVLRITNKKKPVLHNYTMHDQILENVDQNPYLGVIS